MQPNFYLKVQNGKSLNDIETAEKLIRYIDTLYYVERLLEMIHISLPSSILAGSVLILRVQVFLVSHLLGVNSPKAIIGLITVLGLASKSSAYVVDKSSLETFNLKNDIEIEKIQKRIIKACLAVAILKKLSSTGIVGPSHIITFFKTKYDINISPGTVYPVFCKMEKDGDIERLLKKTNHLFILTEKGAEKVSYFHNNLERFYDCFDDLIL